MAASRDWFQRADWSRRSPEFGALRETEKHGQPFVAMEFAPPGASETLVSERLWQLWLDLPSHPHVLEAVAVTEDHRLLLRYAALDWAHPAIKIDGGLAPAAKLATWGVELTRVCEFLSVCVSEDERGWLACPIVRFDLEGEIRIAFAPAAGSTSLMSRLPPEVVEQWPRCDERGLVFVVGQLLLGLVKLTGRTSKTPMGQIIECCLAKDPMRRFASLKDLREMLVAAGGDRNAVAGVSQPAVWDRLEMALGYLELDQPTKALVWIDVARGFDPGSASVERCRAEALRRGGVSPEVKRLTWSSKGSRLPEPKRILPWTDAQRTAPLLEEQRNFVEAIAIYNAVQFEGADVVALWTAEARCHLHLGEFGHALDFAERALRRDPQHHEAVTIRVTALLRRKDYREALVAADQWRAQAPEDALAHHARGKSLLGLGRLVEARDAFELACKLRPQLLEAMLLRREVDRSMARVRSTAGAASAMTIDLPDHLAELRDVLVSGRLDEGIQLLRRPAFEHDAIAQLVLAELLAFDRRFAEALPAYEAASQLGTTQLAAALLGQARMLVELGRGAEAVALFERLEAEHPEEIEALEGHAQALRLLGRVDDAEEIFHRYIAASGKRSDLRVRART